MGGNGDGRLTFLPSGTPQGFASKSVSSDNDVKPSIVVRELIQNGLDAGTEIGEAVQIDFSFGEMDVADIPGIGEYRAAFGAAMDAHKKPPQSAKAQVERIQAALGAASVPVLTVRDNGVGLDGERTNRLLSDGMTDKVGDRAGAAGSYGLGHYTAFPASDLQYVIYGGVTKCGERTMSGHAILASHFNAEKDLLGQDGYYIAGEPQADLFNRFSFPEKGRIPPAVDRALDDVEGRFGHGSVVMLLGFNDFRGAEDPEGDILRAAARHFHPVISNGELSVSVTRGGGARRLDAGLAAEILAEGKSERRSTSDTINGFKAHASWLTLKEGAGKAVDTPFGKARLFLRPANPDERTSVSLFRSGMFITDSVPMNRRQNFAEFSRFNAVILLDAPKPGEVRTGFNVIRQAEGEKHISIDKNRLAAGNKKAFDGFLKAIRERIRGMATKDDSDTFVPEGFMEMELASDAKRINPRRPPSKQKAEERPKPPPSGGFTPVPETMGAFPDGPPKGKRKKFGGRKGADGRPGRVVPADASGRRTDKGLRLVIRPTEDIAHAVLRLRSDSGGDASCTAPLPDGKVRLRMAGGTGGFVDELPLGGMRKGERHEAVVDVEDGLPDLAVLKADVLSRQPPAQRAEGKA